MGMAAVSIILGVIFILVTVILVMVAFDHGSIIPIGGAVIFGTLGGLLFVRGVHGVQHVHSREHQAIFRDISGQGFRVSNGDVFQYGSSVRFRAGTCLFMLDATKIDGTWRVTVPSIDGNGAIILTPAGVANLASACK